MDSLKDDEVEGIWKRVKKYIDLNEIKSADKMNQKRELNELLEKTTTAKDNKNPQSSMQKLKDFGFSDRALKNESIRNELKQNSLKNYEEKQSEKFKIEEKKEITISKGSQKGFIFEQFFGTKKGGKRKGFAGRKLLSRPEKEKPIIRQERIKLTEKPIENFTPIKIKGEQYQNYYNTQSEKFNIKSTKEITISKGKQTGYKYQIFLGTKIGGSGKTVRAGSQLISKPSK